MTFIEDWITFLKGLLPPRPPFLPAPPWEVPKVPKPPEVPEKPPEVPEKPPEEPSFPEYYVIFGTAIVILSGPTMGDYFKVERVISQPSTGPQLRPGITIHLVGVTEVHPYNGVSGTATFLWRKEGFDCMSFEPRFESK